MNRNEDLIKDLSVRGPTDKVGNLVETLNNMSGRSELEILYARLRDVEEDVSTYGCFLSLADGVNLEFDRGLCVERFAKTGGAIYKINGQFIGSSTSWTAFNGAVDLADSRGLIVKGEYRNELAGMIIDYNIVISGHVRKLIETRGIIQDRLKEGKVKIKEEKITPLAF